jgi:hypothetical protein
MDIVEHRIPTPASASASASASAPAVDADADADQGSAQTQYLGVFDIRPCEANASTTLRLAQRESRGASGVLPFSKM